MPLLKRRAATTTDDGRPLCRYCHVAVSVDAHGCCELGHRVMSPEDAAILRARVDAEAQDAAATMADRAGQRTADPAEGEADDDLESLIAEAARAERGAATPGDGDGDGFEGEYREDDDAHELADELDSLWAMPSAGAPTEALTERRGSPPTEAFSALQADAPTEPLGSPAHDAPTTRLNGSGAGHRDLGLADLTEEERAAVHAPAGQRRGESALDDFLDVGDERG